MMTRASAAFGWVRARIASLIFATIGICAAALAMRQSYHFGHGLGVTEIGKESYAQWLTLTDVATTLLPISTVVLWRMGVRKSSVALGMATLLFTAFSISNQIGFGAAERLGKSAQIEAINRAAADAKAEQARLVKDQIRWNNRSVLNQGASRSSRKENIASTERLIANTGTIDPNAIYSAPTDMQATALVSLVNRWFPSWGATTEGMALFLVVAVSVLGILIKPIFLGLSTFFYPTKASAQQQVTREKSKDDDHDQDQSNRYARVLDMARETEASIQEKDDVRPASQPEQPQAPLAAARGDKSARPVLRQEVAQLEEAAEERETEPSISSYLLKPKEKGERVIPFKSRDTRKHARMDDGHIEEFVRTLPDLGSAGELLPFRSSVFERYKTFCADKNLRHMHDKALSNALSRFGIARHRPHGGSVYLRLPEDLEKRIVASKDFFDGGALLATAH